MHHYFRNQFRARQVLKLLKTLSILLVLIAMDEISLFSLNYPSISQ